MKMKKSFLLNLRIKKNNNFYSRKLNPVVYDDNELYNNQGVF